MKSIILSIIVVLSVCLLPVYSFGLEGKCIEGDCANGHGIYVYQEGEKYVGEWKDNKYHGQGTLIETDGRRFEGEWREGEKVKGVQIYSDGGKWVGGFNEEGLFDGAGELTTPDGVIGRGVWKNGNIKNIELVE